tara:strand:+ start:2911 stop:3660 length:750 start_codon:yes stop_codon:yes gene_type:complete
MAYFTGRDVTVWITTEHADDGIKMGNDPATALFVDADADDDTTQGSQQIVTGLNAAGLTAWALSDITGVDVSVGAQDEEISFMGLRNVGKIEVKKDTSISLTRKKGDVRFSMLFQGQTDSNNSNGDGKHGARYGLIANSAGAMKISDGTTDPKSTTGDATVGTNISNQCFGYRVFVELKAESAAGVGDGEVLVIPNCMFSEYGHTLSNESANEETFTMTSQVKPFIYNATKSSSKYALKAVYQTETALI